MPDYSVNGVLLDIEGTTSAIAYVYDVMFPFARTGLDAYLDHYWGDAETSAAAEQIARDAGHASLEAWVDAADEAVGDTQSLVRDEVVRLMDGDLKATGLKQLQGLIWQAGFESGDLRAHVFADVPPALEAWRAAGLDLRIYSSGSVHAQKLFFGHADLGESESGDLLPLFSGHYDTTTGPKKEPASYTAIAADWGIASSDVLFLSDVVAELDAAREAGMATGLMLREGNQPVDDAGGHPSAESFAEIKITQPA